MVHMTRTQKEIKTFVQLDRLSSVYTSCLRHCCVTQLLQMLSHYLLSSNPTECSALPASMFFPYSFFFHGDGPPSAINYARWDEILLLRDSKRSVTAQDRKRCSGIHLSYYEPQQVHLRWCAVQAPCPRIQTPLWLPTADRKRQRCTPSVLPAAKPAFPPFSMEGSSR